MSDRSAAEIRVLRGADGDMHDPTWWLRLSADERVELCWELSEEAWTLSGVANEPRLSRSVTRIVRPAR